MKVLHLTAGPMWQGAALGACRLHQGLRAIGVDSYFAGENTQKVEDPYIHNTFTTINRFKKNSNKVWNRLLLLKYLRRRNEMFNCGRDLFSHWSSQDLKAYDLIHLHWVNDAIGVQAIKRLSQQHRVIWTMRDMWPITGGCHYSLGCSNYSTKCGSCPTLQSSDPLDISRSNFQAKKEAFRNISFVTVSDWLRKCALESGIVSGDRVRTIYNSVDSNVFKKRDIHRAALRQQYGILSDKPIALFGALDNLSPYKGVSALRGFIETYPQDFHYLGFGLNAAAVSSAVTSVGFVDDPEQLSILYNLSDVFLMFSEQEAFGKTVIESLCCGTPVVTRPGSAPEEILRSLPESCGLIWVQQDDFATEISRLISHSEDIPHEEIAQRFSNEAIAQEYGNLYEGLLILFNDPWRFDNLVQD